MIERVTMEDMRFIRELVEKEFPYVKKTGQKIESKIDNPHFFLFKISEQGRFAGFVEIEVLEEHTEVRLNGLAIIPEYREKGLGKKLLHETIEFLRGEDFEIVWLLVKRTNTVARTLYEKEGFNWVQTLPQQIDNAVVEEYCLELKTEKDSQHLGVH